VSVLAAADLQAVVDPVQGLVSRLKGERSDVRRDHYQSCL
jgi:hypothetical protein